MSSSMQHSSLDLPFNGAVDLEEYEFDVTSGHDQDKLRVRWGGREVLGHDIPIETPSQPYAVLKYCVAGSGVLDWESDRWKVEQGMAFWSTARNASTLMVGPHGGMVNMGILLSGNQAIEQMDRFLHVPVGVARLQNPGLIEATFTSIMVEGRGCGTHREDICALLAEVLLRQISQEAVMPAAANALARSTFNRCREYIETNFLGINSLKAVAEACDVTVPYLCRLFDQFFHRSPHEYMTQLKMVRAESLLLRPVVPVRQVANAVGYKDARLFSRNFKAAFGKSPTEYRQVNAIVESIGD